jgi:hypothetical protein
LSDPFWEHPVTDEADPAHWLQPSERGGAYLNPPTAASSRHMDVTASMPTQDDTSYLGPPIQPPPPGPITFEDPAMATAHAAGGIIRDRQIAQRRADMNRRGAA